MSALAEVQKRLRQRSEYSLRLAAMDHVARRYPGKISKPALPAVGWFWRIVFVPLFRRIPWSFKQKAMRTFRMTAQGWPVEGRRFGEPWRPPTGAGRAGGSGAAGVGDAAGVGGAAGVGDAAGVGGAAGGGGGAEAAGAAGDPTSRG